MGPDPLPERDLGRRRTTPGLRRRSSRGPLHRVHLPPQSRPHQRPADRAPGQTPQPQDGPGRPRRAVFGLPPPRGVHRLPTDHAGSREDPPRPRPGRAGHRRLQGRCPRTFALHFAANAAWLVMAAIAFNLTRAAGTIASVFHAKATTATTRRQLIAVPGRLATSARRLVIHLPKDWPWQDSWEGLFNTVCGPPTPATT